MKNKLLFNGVLIIVLLFSSFCLKAKDGYKIQLKFTDIKDSFAYLAHYYGKPLPTIYKTDSAKIDKNGVAVFQSQSKVLGGIYMVLLSDKKTYFDFLLDNGCDMSIIVTVKDLPLGLKFSNSAENTGFVEYGKFLATFGQQQQKYIDQLTKAKNAIDSQSISNKMKADGKELVAYRKNYIQKDPQSLLSKVFGALSIPEVPEGIHYLSDGKTIDSAFGYLYYKSHYWDGFDFSDDRLIHTPVYDSRLDEYFNKLVFPHEDSVIKESNIILSKTKNSPELFKYSLWWLCRNAETSKVMGMDAVVVYLVENYHMKGAAPWLSQEELQKYINGVRKIAPNVIGNIAPEIKLPDVNGIQQSLQAQKNRYTLLIFWSPDCGHCKEEIPKIDSLYKASLKKKGVGIYAVSTFDEEKPWKDFIKEKKIEDWMHVWDPQRTSDFRENYNVYMTPILYLLDGKKIIKAKRLDYSNIAGIIDHIEKNNNQK